MLIYILYIRNPPIRFSDKIMKRFARLRVEKQTRFVGTVSISLYNILKTVVNLE